jgi:hypothetical protein
MRRLLLTGDWHLSDNPRDAYRFGAVQEIRKLIKQHSVDDLFILGDFTDFPDHHSASFTNRIVELLAGIATAGACVHIVRGNHDASDPSVPFFRFINCVESCRYVTEVMGWEAEGHRVLVVPNGAWPQPFPDGFDMVFAHQTFAGAKAEHGTILNGLRLPLVSGLIFSGDVHVPQRQGMVTYIGAPTLMRFGDTYKPRVLLMDLSFATDPIVRTIPITGPTKRLVEVRAFPDGSLDWINIENVQKGDLVKVRVTFQGALPSLAHLRADIAECVGKPGGTLHAVDMGSTAKITSTPRNPVSRSDADLVRQYATANRFDQPVVKAGLGIVQGGK